MDRTSDNNLGVTLPVLGLFVATLLAALAYFSAPGWLWATTSAWLVLALIAALAQSDPSGRAYLTATLKHSRYTQLYLSIARPVNDWVWRRVGRMQAGADGTRRPPNERAGLWALMRDAMTGQMVDRALLLAVVYPIVVISVPWLLGSTANLGLDIAISPLQIESAFVVIALIATAIFFIIELNQRLTFIVLEKLNHDIDKSAPTRTLIFIFRYWKFFSVWLRSYRLLFAISGVLSLAFLFSFMLIDSFWPSLALALAIAFVTASSGTDAIKLVIAYTTMAIGFGTSSMALFVISLFAFASSLSLTSRLKFLPKFERDAHKFSILSAFWFLSIAIIQISIDPQSLSVERKATIVFLAVLPFINGLFDTLSYAATLATMRKGLATRWAWALGVLDLLIGAVLFLALGATMVAVIAALNVLGNAPLYDLSALFAGLRSDPGDYWWLYLILFSTLLPTALHLGIAALAVQGVIPQSWRRRVARWIDASPASALDAVRGCLAQSLIWWLPLLGLAGLGYALWLWVGHAAGVAGLFYLDALETLALWIGAL